MLRKLLLYIEDSFFLLTLLIMVVQVIPITIGFLPLHCVSNVTKLRGNTLSNVNRVQHTKV